MNKKFFFKRSFLVFLCAFSLISCEKEIILPPSEIPSEIQSFVLTHFPNNSVVQVVKDRDVLKKTYDIYLSDGISLEFNSRKEVIEINSNSSLPNSVMSEKITQFVATNYPSNFITYWELEARKQEIRLDNGIYLEFNLQGDFLRIDN
jgi:hypothetical protein